MRWPCARALLPVSSDRALSERAQGHKASPAWLRELWERSAPCAEQEPGLRAGAARSGAAQEAGGPRAAAVGPRPRCRSSVPDAAMQLATLGQTRVRLSSGRQLCANPRASRFSASDRQGQGCGSQGRQVPS